MEGHPENKGAMHGNISHICLFWKRPWEFLRRGFDNQWAAVKGLGVAARIEKTDLLDYRQLESGLDDSILISLWHSEVHVYNLPVHDRWLHYSWRPITHLDAKPEFGRVFQHVHCFWSMHLKQLVYQYKKNSRVFVLVTCFGTTIPSVLSKLYACVAVLPVE